MKRTEYFLVFGLTLFAAGGGMLVQAVVAPRSTLDTSKLNQPPAAPAPQPEVAGGRQCDEWVQQGGRFGAVITRCWSDAEVCFFVSDSSGITLSCFPRPVLPAEMPK